MPTFLIPHPCKRQLGIQEEGLGDARPWLKERLEPQPPISWVGGGSFQGVPGDSPVLVPAPDTHTRGCTCSSHQLRRDHSHLPLLPQSL